MACVSIKQDFAHAGGTCIYCYAALQAFLKSSGWVVISKLSALRLLRAYQSTCVSNRLLDGPVNPSVPICCIPSYMDVLRDGLGNHKTCNCDIAVCPLRLSQKSVVLPPSQTARINSMPYLSEYYEYKKKLQCVSYDV